MFRIKKLLLTLAVIAGTGFTFSAYSKGDEGMWLFNQLPASYLKERYKFQPEAEWIEHVMRASVRMNVGGSASFVSSNGLVLTNHHVGLDTVQKLSTKERDLTKLGFYAKTKDEELKAPDLELNQLVSIKDVTDRINEAVSNDPLAKDAAMVRQAVIATIEKEATEATGNRCNVIELFGGGRYHLYEYKQFTDVRLVWVPESSAAYFGGDADNFEFPRYCLDACIFRVYENDEPATIEHFFKWNDSGPKEGELVFVSGNPGSTSRIFTHAALEYERDVRVPATLDFIRRREVLLQQFGLQGSEYKRQANDELMSFQNARKNYMGQLAGLQDPQIMKMKADEEVALLAKIKADPKLSSYASAWEELADVQSKYAELQKESISLNTRIFNMAHTFVQMAAEDQKPDSERLPRFTESGRGSLKQQLLSRAPIYLELESTKLADLISRTIERRGANDPLVKEMLGGKSPTERASSLVNETQIASPEFRQQLYDGGPSAIENSQDPMIQFSRLMDPEIRRLGKASDALDEVETQAYAKIAEAMFAIKGTSVYPDATFTLRLAFGTVKGYEENGKPVAAWTTMGGAFEHEASHDSDDFVLPDSWKNAKDNINKDQPYNFVCTADIIGGNSGSPVVNQAGELVGLIFDGNIQSLTGDFFYSDVQSRATSVHAGAIREALRNIYGAEALANELGQ